MSRRLMLSKGKIFGFFWVGRFWEGFRDWDIILLTRYEESNT
jgi:hypothetical protein